MKLKITVAVMIDFNETIITVAAMIHDNETVITVVLLIFLNTVIAMTAMTLLQWNCNHSYQINFCFDGSVITMAVAIS